MRLAELRIARGLSQKDMAKEWGCSQNAISNWENGKRQMDHTMLVFAAEYFGVSVDFLLGNDPADDVVDELALKRQQLNNLFNQMTPEERDLLLTVAVKLKKINT